MGKGGNFAGVHSASSLPSACSQNRHTCVQRKSHTGDAEGMGTIPRALANGAAPLLTLRAASSSSTLPLAQTCLPCISPSLGPHVACRIGAELISFPKYPHKLPREKQIKSPALTSPHLWASSLRSGNALPCWALLLQGQNSHGNAPWTLFPGLHFLSQAFPSTPFGLGCGSHSSLHC